MKKPLAIAIGAALSTVLVQPVLAADEAASISDAVKGAKVDLNFRYRFEDVDRQNQNDARASSLKSRLTVTSKAFQGFQGQIQVDNNSDIFGKDAPAAVLDAEYTEVNQAWLSYSGLPATTVKGGKQLVNLDNQRFIGGVGWRQNEQTHDAIAVINKGLPDTTVLLAHVTRVHRFTGQQLDTDTNLLNLNYAGLPLGTLSLYRYEISATADTLPVASNTTGLRFAGNTEAGGMTFNYEAEYALQEENDSAKQAGIDADYLHLSLGADFGTVKAKIGQETLGGQGSGSKAFNTPLGTNHKFNGWADIFAAGTPGAGLVDTYVSVGTKVAGIALTAVYHDFQSDEGSSDYGQEIDLSAAKKVSDNLNLLLKYADYSADNFRVDTRKLWLQAQLNF